jgi:hypothetical protein
MKTTTIISWTTGALGGLAAIFGVWLGIRTAIRSHAWKETTARVVSSVIDSRDDSESGKVFSAVYTVQYEVGGRLVESTLKSNPATNSEADIRGRIAQHPPGTQRAIFYNPSKPTEIDPAGGSGMLRAAFAFVALGLIFLIAGGLLWYGTQPAEW